MKRHLYHMVDKSPWPIICSLSVFFLLIGLAFYMHKVENGFFLVLLGLFMVFLIMYVWWRDVIRESTYQGNHTLIVQRGLRLGFILFIASEVMFFAGFFWAFFHSSLCPSIELGIVWPPVNIVPLSPWGVPLLNTAILLLSGFSITWVHFSLIYGNSNYVIQGFFMTLILAILFTSFQLSEYLNAPFNITDSIYGTTFYSLTGLHGLHVIIGTIFIFVCFVRFLLVHFTSKHHLGFEFASWYWHFVDVVWLFLFIFVYIWGSW